MKDKDRPCNQEDSFVDLDIPNECKEFYILEWESDHGHKGWWSYNSIINSSISRGSDNMDDWHCMLIECRVLADPNIITRQEIAKKFHINESDMIIL